MRWRVLIPLLALICGSAAAQEEPAKGVRLTESVRRPEAGAVRRIAIVPPVVVLRFEERGRLPSPDRFTTRRAIARELPGALRALLEPRLKVSLNESVAAALAEEGLKPVDLYQTARGAEEVLTDRRNSCRLAMARAALRSDPLQVTVFRYVPEALKNLPQEDAGLATLQRGVQPRLQTENVARLARRLGVEALLLLRVEDIDTKEGLVGIQMEKYKSSWVTVHASLVSATDLQPLWEATLQGHSSTRERRIPGAAFSEGYNKAEDRLALDGMTKLLPVLADRLPAGG